MADDDEGISIRVGVMIVDGSEGGGRSVVGVGCWLLVLGLGFGFWLEFPPKSPLSGERDTNNNVKK